MAKSPQTDPMKYVKPALIVGGSFLGWRYVIAPLLETLGVKDTAEDKLMDKIEQLDVDRDYWSANFYTKAPANHNALIFNTAKANELCEQIKEAKGIFNDDESAIYAAFRQCQYKTQVSYLVYWFNRLYALDLYSWLKDKVLNPSEMRTVLTITEKLPLGFRNLSTNKISGVGSSNKINEIGGAIIDKIKHPFWAWTSDLTTTKDSYLHNDIRAKQPYWDALEKNYATGKNEYERRYHMISSSYSDMNAEIKKDFSCIRIFGTYLNHSQGPKSFDLKFCIGDIVKIGQYNLIYTGKIVKISKNTVEIIDNSGSIKRFGLMQFIDENKFFDLDKIKAYNTEESLYI